MRKETEPEGGLGKRSRGPGSAGAGLVASACTLPVEQLQRIRRGHAHGRSPDLLMVPRAPNFFGALPAVTSHSGPWDYVQKVPLVLYGPGFIRALGDLHLARHPTLADIAPTIAELIGLPWPRSRPGRAISQALVPEEERAGGPALVLVIVWDGGGWNVLNRWPDSWPTLARMARQGASVRGVVVGSSPSVTPAVHATIGTGAFPKQHGVVDIPLRTRNGILPYSFPGGSSRVLDMSTLADLHDRATGNAARVGMFAFQFFHLGMMGHGAAWPGGDRDIAVIVQRQAGRSVTRAGDFETNEDSYVLPPYVPETPGFETDVRTVDSGDGRVDSRWMGSGDLTDPSDVRHSPVWVHYQTRITQEILRRESFGKDAVTDLFFTNYKEIDDVGHNWNMLEPEMGSVLRSSDAMLDRLIDFLDANVGRGRWVIALTADHGQAPLPSSSGAWPIRMRVMTRDLGRRFGIAARKIIAEERPTGLWLDRSALEAEGITQKDIARWLMDYRLEDNVKRDEDVPSRYRTRLEERLFAAVFPARELRRIWGCARRRR
jgi:arylsulfatase A-like enzyme